MTAAGRPRTGATAAVPRLRATPAPSSVGVVAAGAPANGSAGALTVGIAGGFTLDAVIASDGSAELDRVGGNALWAAMGARIAGGRPRVTAVLGDDFPETVLALLADAGLDLAVRRNGRPLGLRVSYSFDDAGARTQPADPRRVAALPLGRRERVIDTTGQTEVRRAALPTVADLEAADHALPADTRAAWHFGVLPLDRFAELVRNVAGIGGFVQADCPDRNELRERGTDVLAETLPLVDVFLPSTSDTDVFAPGASARELLDRFHALGARATVLKCAEDGSLVSVAGGADRSTWHVPAALIDATVDTVGCGDVFAGALLTELARGADLVSAACAGSAAASFGAAVRSPLELLDVDSAEFARRRAVVVAGVRRL